MTLKQLDEFRQSIGKNLGAAVGDDQVKLDAIDGFIGTILRKKQVASRVEFMKQARKIAQGKENGGGGEGKCLGYPNPQPRPIGRFPFIPAATSASTAIPRTLAPERRR